MKFAQPEILWGLIALAIPIIVHLFNFRRFKRVAFSNVAFLKEVQQETKSRSKLKHLLILTSRLLAILFLVLAFSQPFIPLEENSGGNGKRSVSLYIDNSYSMDAQSEDGRLLDLSKQKAVELIESYSSTDLFQVLSNDLEPRQQRFYNQEDAIEMVEEIQVSPAVKNVEEIVQRQQDLLMRQSEGDLSAFILSDLQESTHRISNFVPDSSISVRFLPELANTSPNVWIDSVWFDTPVRSLNQPEALHLRIRHNATEGLDNLPMRLEVNGSQKAIGSFNLVPGTYTDTTLFYTITEPGWQHCEIELQDYPITYDDSWFFSYEIAKQIRILRIKGDISGNAVAKAYGNDPFYNVESIASGNVNYGELPEYGLVILDQLTEISTGLVRELSSYMNKGGSVMVIPGKNARTDGYTELLLSGGASGVKQWREDQINVSEINLDHPFYTGVFDRIPENIDLPKVSGSLVFDRGSRSNEEVLLRLQNGDPFFIRSKSGSGQLFVCASSLAPTQSSFAQHALFVPTLLRVAEFSNLSSRMDFFQGEEDLLRLRSNPLSNDESFLITNIQDGSSYIPRYRSVPGGVEVFLGDQMGSPGNHTLSAGDSIVSVLGMNFSRKESSIDPWETNEWEQVLADAGWDEASVVQTNIDNVRSVIEELDQGKTLWETFIWLAIFMLILEVLLIKFWRT